MVPLGSQYLTRYSACWHLVCGARPPCRSPVSGGACPPFWLPEAIPVVEAMSGSCPFAYVSSISEFRVPVKRILRFLSGFPVALVNTSMDHPGTDCKRFRCDICHTDGTPGPSRSTDVCQGQSSDSPRSLDVLVEACRSSPTDLDPSRSGTARQVVRAK